MKTYKHIIAPLERKILAAALNTFRKLPIPYTTDERLQHKPMYKYKGSWVVYASTINGFVIDQCYINTKTWQLDHITYLVNKGKKKVSKTIQLSAQEAHQNHV